MSKWSIQWNIIKVCFERSVPWFCDIDNASARESQNGVQLFDPHRSSGRLLFVDIAVAKPLTDNLKVIDKTGSYD